MKKIFSILLLFVIVTGFTSCSITFEKRRYRPGYHVDMVKNRSNTPLVQKENPLFVRTNEIMPVKLKTDEKHITNIPVSLNKKSINVAGMKGSVIIKNKTTKPLPKRFIIKRSHQFNKSIYQTDDVHVKSKLGLILGLVFGGISFVLTITGIVFFAIGGIGGILTGMFIFIPAVITLILALVLGLIKWKNKEEVKPVSSGFINAGFILSIIAGGLGVLSFIFSFLVYPFGWIALGMAVTALVMGIIAFSFGFRSLRGDKSLKTKFTIILGFVAVLLFILALIFLFL